jgi:hypothetical protein
MTLSNLLLTDLRLILIERNKKEKADSSNKHHSYILLFYSVNYAIISHPNVQVEKRKRACTRCRACNKLQRNALVSSTFSIHISTNTTQDFDIPKPNPQKDKHLDIITIEKDILDSISQIYCIQPKPPKQVIDKYSDRFRKKPPVTDFRKTPTSLAFFPVELQHIKDPSVRPVKKNTTNLNAKDIFKNIDEGAENTAKEGDEENEDEQEEVPIEEESEEDNDYVEDYWNEDFDPAGEDNDEQGDYF